MSDENTIYFIDPSKIFFIKDKKLDDEGFYEPRLEHKILSNGNVEFRLTQNIPPIKIIAGAILGEIRDADDK